MILIIIAVGLPISIYILSNAHQSELLFLNALELAEPGKITQLLLQVYSHELFLLYLPWVTSVISILVMSKLLTGVRMRKEGVVILALIVQMFLPDPYVEKSVKVEQIETKKSKRKLGNKKVLTHWINLDNTWR